MFKSDQLGQLADALSKAQGQMGNAKKDSANPFFKSKYADLASVVDASKAELTANGLAVVQLPTMRDGKMVLEYVLLHSSGEFIGSELEMTPVKSDPQGIGSAITYARRYTWSSLTGVATEDDDGNAASGKDSRPARPTAERSTEERPLTRSGPQQAGESIQGGKPAGPVISTVVNRDPVTVAPVKAYKDTFDPAVIEAKAVVTDAYITSGQAQNLHKEFRAEVKKHAPNEMMRADDHCYQFLTDEGFLNDKGEPTAGRIPATRWFDIKEKALKYARNLSA